jgi:hypothetical protein
MTTIFDKAITGYRFVDTQHGDTLQKIAYREMGDASQWPLLIAYNQLVYPFITDDPELAGAGVILTGAQILVPAPVPAIASTTNPALVFQIDIGLNLAGELQVDASGDFAVVSGVKNLVQALNGRIVTDAGELIYHPEYGNLLRQLLGVMNGPNAGLLASQYATSAVLADPRVATVDSSAVTITGDATQVSIALTPIIGRPVAFTSSL